jgi:hypothetical protein
MANSNLNIQIVPFFDSVKSPLASDGVSKGYWVNGYDNLAVEVSGTGSGTIVVQGCINTVNADGQQLEDQDISWTDLSMLSATNYSQKATITENGIYYVAISGVSRLRIEATGVSGTLTIVGALSK